jgi:hypothetical protein
MPKSWPIQKIRMLLSSLTARFQFSTVPSHQDVTVSSSPAKVLSSCYEVTMGQLEDCICDNNLSTLVVSGEPSALQLAEAWSSIFFEYCELAEDSETRYRVLLDAQLTLDKKKEELGQGWATLLKHKYSEDIAEALRIIGFEFELNPNDPEQYQADLKRINGELGYLRLTIKIKEAQWTALMDKQSTHDTVDRKYFSTIYFAINNYAKREAVNRQTIVADYCAALRAFVGDGARNK